MRLLSCTYLATLMFGAMVGVANAEAPAMPDSTPKFEAIDTDGDGQISKREAADSWLANAFARVDANGDGYVTKAEYDDATS